MTITLKDFQAAVTIVEFGEKPSPKSDAIGQAKERQFSP